MLWLPHSEGARTQKMTSSNSRRKRGKLPSPHLAGAGRRWGRASPEPRHRAPPSATAADALCPSTTRARHQQSPESGTIRAAASRRALLSLCSALSSPRSLSESALPSHWSRAQLAAEGPPRRSPFLGRWRYGERAPGGGPGRAPPPLTRRRPPPRAQERCRRERARTICVASRERRFFAYRSVR